MKNFQQRIVFHLPAILSEFHLRDWNRYCFELVRATFPLLQNVEPVIFATGPSRPSILKVWKEFNELLTNSRFSYCDFSEISSNSVRENESLSEFFGKVFDRHLLRLNPERLLSIEPADCHHSSRSFSMG